MQNDFQPFLKKIIVNLLIFKENCRDKCSQYTSTSTDSRVCFGSFASQNDYKLYLIHFYSEFAYFYEQETLKMFTRHKHFNW